MRIQANRPALAVTQSHSAAEAPTLRVRADSFEQQTVTFQQGVPPPSPGGVGALSPQALQQLASAVFAPGQHDPFTRGLPTVPVPVGGTGFSILSNRDGQLTPLSQIGNPDLDQILVSGPGGVQYTLGTRAQLRAYVMANTPSPDILAGLRQWGDRTSALVQQGHTLPTEVALGLALYQSADFATLGGLSAATDAAVDWAACDAEANNGLQPEGCGPETVMAGVQGTLLATSFIEGPFPPPAASANATWLQRQLVERTRQLAEAVVEEGAVEALQALLEAPAFRLLPEDEQLALLDQALAQREHGVDAMLGVLPFQ